VSLLSPWYTAGSSPCFTSYHLKKIIILVLYPYYLDYSKGNDHFVTQSAPAADSFWSELYSKLVLPFQCIADIADQKQLYIPPRLSLILDQLVQLGKCYYQDFFLIFITYQKKVP